ncbi:NADP-dependent oxidoreductase [Mycetocola reblochoni]|uniref:NADP-dependent oxidoreductase n=2 Tax=Mycetocola reblochoni TaxID=331618 RepID=A0A3L6ZT71_9MICO|nr:NADP-dependent oxidoreductase [Mycetocola reblochoni]RLP71156.1 NADP-dependent oxidoreductase [Mycetocola reblochoni]SJN40939.1 Putative oxidoreductase YncB [Mycetocola reblochoni REB411]
MTTTSTQIQLVRRPVGWPTHDDVRTVSVPLDELADGEVRVRNEFLSVDPYMRGRMNDVRSYVAPFALGETMTGGAVGRVVESRSADHAVGDLVLHQLGWRDVAQADAAAFRVLPAIEGTSPSLYLSVLGMTGFTAYLGLTRIARLAEGDRVFISGAAGAVGTAAGQIARLLGASQVIGSAGSDEKTALLRDKYGYDIALNYRDAPIREQLNAAVGETGIDVYFDNVGGDHLEAALDVFNDGGRAALCGAIVGYNSTERTPGPDNMSAIITRALTLTGFTVGAHLEHYPEFTARMTEWFGSGLIAVDETVVTGLENTFDAFLAMLRGANTGKMIVAL